MKAKANKNVVLKNISKTAAEAINMVMEYNGKTTVSDTCIFMLETFPLLWGSSVQIYQKLRQKKIVLNEKIILFDKSKVVSINV